MSMEEGDLFDHTYACQAKWAQDLIAKERRASKSLAASGKWHREDNSEQTHEADGFDSQTLVNGQEKTGTQVLAWDWAVFPSG